MRTILASLLLTACVTSPDDLSTVESAVHVYQSTPISVARTKEVILTCPAGTIGTARGYAATSIDNGSIRAVLGYALGMEPLDGGTQWRVRATVPDGTPEWWLEASTSCIPPPAGYVLVTAKPTYTTSDRNAIQLDCPDGKLPIGAGFMTHGTQTEPRRGEPLVARLTSSRPAHGESWVATATALKRGASWGMSGALACADAGALPGFSIVVAPNVLGGHIRGFDAVCPAPRQPITGGWAGLDANDNVVDAYADSEVGRRLHPSIEHAWSVWASADPSVTAPWRLAVTAICVD